LDSNQQPSGNRAGGLRTVTDGDGFSGCFQPSSTARSATGLDANGIDPDVDEDEVERLADLARETLGQERRPPPPK